MPNEPLLDWGIVCDFDFMFLIFIFLMWLYRFCNDRYNYKDINKQTKNIGCNFIDFILSDIFVELTPKASATKAKIQKLHYIRVKWSEVTQLCPTLCDSVDCSPPGSSVHGILQARILEWVTISFSRGSSRPRDRSWV